MYVCTYVTLPGIVDPPGNTIAKVICQESVRRLQIEWDMPSTLVGVDITNYTIEVEGMQFNTSGSDNKIAVQLHSLNPLSCQNQTVCVSATTLAGMSNFSCVEFEAFLIESKN